MVVDGDPKKDECATKETMLDYFKDRFKEQGFKKTKQTWYKSDGTLIHMFNVQNSQFGDDSFYLNIGVNFAEEGLRLASSDWNVEARMLYGKNMEDTFNNAMSWYEKFNTVEKIIKASKMPNTAPTSPLFAINKYLEKHNLVV